MAHRNGLGPELGDPIISHAMGAETAKKEGSRSAPKTPGVAITGQSEGVRTQN